MERIEDFLKLQFSYELKHSFKESVCLKIVYFLVINLIPVTSLINYSIVSEF